MMLLMRGLIFPAFIDIQMKDMKDNDDFINNNGKDRVLSMLKPYIDVINGYKSQIHNKVVIDVKRLLIMIIRLDIAIESQKAIGMVKPASADERL